MRVEIADIAAQRVTSHLSQFPSFSHSGASRIVRDCEIHPLRDANAERGGMFEQVLVANETSGTRGVDRGMGEDVPRAVMISVSSIAHR